MPEHEYEYDYDRIANDADELLDYWNYSNEYEEKEYSDYYFNLTQDID